MQSSYWLGLLGGALIGGGSLLALVLTQKIPGISGVFGRLFRPDTDDRGWRLLFLIGMIVGAFALFQTVGAASVFRIPEGRTLPIFALAGLLVGFGTRLGGGCTSGHGVCGTGMGARDSMLATLVFMIAGIVTVYLFKTIGVSA